MLNPILPSRHYIVIGDSHTILEIRKGQTGFTDFEECESVFEAYFICDALNRAVLEEERIALPPNEILDRMVRGSMFGWPFDPIEALWRALYPENVV